MPLVKSMPMTIREERQFVAKEGVQCDKPAVDFVLSAAQWGVVERRNSGDWERASEAGEWRSGTLSGMVGPEESDAWGLDSTGLSLDERVFRELLSAGFADETEQVASSFRMAGFFSFLLHISSPFI